MTHPGQRARRAFATLGVCVGLGVPGVAAAGGTPWFDRQTDPFDPEACSGTGCWTNYVRAVDLNGDDALDVVLVNYAGLVVPGTAEPLVIYENDGSGAFTDVSTEAVDNHSGRIRQVAIGDVDGDGDLDMYAPSGQADGDAFFINDGLGVFTDEVATRLPGLDSYAGAARFFDVDNDGDLDLFLADGYVNDSASAFGHLYLNDGDGNFTEQAGAFPTTLGGEDIDDVDIFDADRDFDLDVMVNPHSGNNSLWINNGDLTFDDASSDLPNQPNLYHYNPAVCDVDGDGDIDIWVDNMGPTYSEQLLINDGTGVFTDQTASRVTGNSLGADDNGVACVDLDLDGDFDAVVFSLASPERFLQNDGTGNFTFVSGVFPATTDSTLWGDFGDLDGDDRIDLVTGQGEGSTSDEVDIANANVVVDGRAPDIIESEAPPAVVPADTEVVVRYAVADRVVTDDGPRLSAAFGRVSFDGGTPQTIPATFMGGDVFRLAIPPQVAGTTAQVEVCAVDRAGNEGCLDAGGFQVGDDGGTDSGTESGATASGSATATDSGASDSASATGGTGGVTGASDGSGDAGGDTETTAGGDGGDDGCGCVTASRDAGAPWWAALVGLFALVRRRRT